MSVNTSSYYEGHEIADLAGAGFMKSMIAMSRELEDLNRDIRPDPRIHLHTPLSSLHRITHLSHLLFHAMSLRTFPNLW